MIPVSDAHSAGDSCRDSWLLNGRLTLGRPHGPGGTMQRASPRGRHVPLPGHRTGLCNFGEKLGLGASEPRAGRLDRLFRFASGVPLTPLLRGPRNPSFERLGKKEDPHSREGTGGGWQGPGFLASDPAAPRLPPQPLNPQVPEVSHSGGAPDSQVPQDRRSTPLPKSGLLS